MIEYKKYAEIAFANVADPDESAYYRQICRFYSKTFFTPLHQVFNLDPELVVSAYFEERASQLEENGDLEEHLAKIADPDYDENEERLLQEFIEREEREAREKARAGASKTAKKPRGKTRVFEDEPPPVVGEDI
jgi:hypothetical protein